MDQAAHGIAIRWEALSFLTGQAFGTAAMALVGQNLGAGRPDQAVRSGWTALALGGMWMACMGAVFFVLAPEMFGLFCPKPEQAPIVAAGVPVLRLVALAQPALASTNIFTAALRGAGDTRVPVLITWFGFFGVRIPLAYLLLRPELRPRPARRLDGDVHRPVRPRLAHPRPVRQRPMEAAARLSRQAPTMSAMVA